ncbi:hypothetical protein ABIC16_001652 [Sphingomonas sp. PvP055]|uniref:hypothetical protein n=1 Tax=Sphingomonas sp. PvP055 TaxID=3156391 RepID=UPI0033946E9A
MSAFSAKRYRFTATAAIFATTIVGLSLSGTDTGAKAQLVPPVVPDVASWQQFVLAVSPSGTVGKVTYETFASDQDIYVSNPCPSPKPSSASVCNSPTWPSATNATKTLQRSLLGRTNAHPATGEPSRFKIEVIGPKQGCGKPSGIDQAAKGSKFPKDGCIGEEVRRDRPSFDYLVTNGLWSTAGLVQYYATNQPVSLPWNTLEVKADWIPVKTLATWLGQSESFVTTNFYTSSVKLETGETKPFAMTSMHLMVKSPGFPNWVWANFENAFVPGRCDVTGCTDSYGATKTYVPPNPTAWGQYGACPKTAAVSAMMTNASVAPVFANYCMTGSQTAFTANSLPTLLGSPVIETLNANVALTKSSCISCHAGASFNASGKPGRVNTTIGPNAPASGYIGYDLMWGVLGAQ